MRLRPVSSTGRRGPVGSDRASTSRPYPVRGRTTGLGGSSAPGRTRRLRPEAARAPLAATATKRCRGWWSPEALHELHVLNGGILVADSRLSTSRGATPAHDEQDRGGTGRQGQGTVETWSPWRCASAACRPPVAVAPSGPTGRRRAAPSCAGPPASAAHRRPAGPDARGRRPRERRSRPRRPSAAAACGRRRLSMHSTFSTVAFSQRLSLFRPSTPKRKRLYSFACRRPSTYRASASCQVGMAMS